MARINVPAACGGELTMNIRRIGVGAGNGPPVVMIHGLSADNLSSLYYTLAPPLIGYADVILYDLRGHGRSDRPPTGYGLDDTLQDLYALLDVLEVDQPIHLVGHSYGGAVSIAHALDRPERTASMVLIEGHVARPGWAEYMAASIAFLAFSIERPEVLEWMAENGGRKGNRAMDDVRSLINDTSWVHDIEHRTRTVTDDQLRTIEVPALSIFGELSDVIDSGREVAELMADCTMEVVADQNHSLLLPCAEMLGHRVDSWLRAQVSVEV